MKTKTKVKEVDFIELYNRFIKESSNGKRLQPNGKKISKGTVDNYRYSLSLMEKFCKAESFHLRLRPVHKLNSRELVVEKNYWKKFYKKFTGYLYDKCGYYDNYVGATIKNIRTFFTYLKKEKGIDAGDFYKQFYVRKEDIAIFPLMPEELNYLIYNQKFEDSLSARLKEVKDFIVFGCTVALRFSDLNNLRKSNMRQINENYYLAIRSQKTSTDTLVKLPDYAVKITERYARRKRKLLPCFNAANINIYIKELFEKAGFTQTVCIVRNRRGKPVMQKGKEGKELRLMIIGQQDCSGNFKS